MSEPKFNKGDIVLWRKGCVGEITKIHYLNDGDLNEEGKIEPWYNHYYSVSNYDDGIIQEQNLILVRRAENSEDADGKGTE